MCLAPNRLPLTTFFPPSFPSSQKLLLTALFALYPDSYPNPFQSHRCLEQEQASDPIWLVIVSNLEIEFSNTCQFRCFFWTEDIYTWGTISAGMEKLRQKWHSHTAELDERTWRRGERLSWLLGLSSSSFFWGSTPLVSLWFYANPTPETLFGLS